METNLVVEGAKFMMLGMGAVFLFLIILIILMNLMSWVIHRFFPEPQTNVKVVVNEDENKRKIVAAITAAIAHHRGR